MPFSDLTVIDVASLAAAPQIATFFADLGARVIKVEPPSGDPLRHLLDERGVALNWKLVNRNKECVTLDLSSEAGQALMDRLLERADLLVTNHPPRRLLRFGLDRDRLRERFPELVVVSLTAYGLEGPWAARPGSGTLAEASAGLAALTGEADQPPGLSPVGLGDHLGILQGIIAALVGLLGRDASTRAASEAFDVAMYEPILNLLGTRLATAERSGADPERYGNRFPTMAPRNTYATADGRWVALTAGTNALVRRLFSALGQPELFTDERFATNQSRLDHVEELDAILADWIGARPCDEVVGILAPEGVSVAAVDGPAAVLANPHFAARGNLTHLADSEAGPVPVPVVFPGLTEATGAHLGRPLGADNSRIYQEWLGLSKEELAALAAGGVI